MVQLVEITPEMEAAGRAALKRQLYDYGEEWQDAEDIFRRLDINLLYRSMEEERKRVEALAEAADDKQVARDVAAINEKWRRR
jgi:hypothetical protein